MYVKFSYFCFCAALALLSAACSSFQPVQERIDIDPRATPISAGLAEAQFDSPFGTKLVKHDLTMSYYPGEDIVCLRFRVNMMTYFQFWSSANRAAFIEALDKYKADYERRELKAKAQARTKRSYGTVRGYLWWETAQFFQRNYSYPQYELGYYFKDRNPYFAVTVREAPNEDKSSNSPNNANLIMYFTRAQADMVVQLFSPDYLGNLRFPPAKDGAQPQIDTYNEGEF